MSASSTSFEYKNKQHETPFETFLRYTNEKEESSKALAEILDDVLPQKASLLDIGAGNGEYLQLSLSKLKTPRDKLELTLVEPSKDLATQLQQRFKDTPHTAIVHADLDSFTTNEKFDFVLASHLFYHLPRAAWPDYLQKLHAFLKPGGTLVIVLREKDDPYDFKMAFKPQLFDPSFKALTIDDVLEVLPKKLSATKHLSESELTIPLGNKHDTIAIIEFYLNKPWAEIPEAIQQNALQFIRDRNGVFKQLDALAIIRSD